MTPDDLLDEVPINRVIERRFICGKRQLMVNTEYDFRLTIWEGKVTDEKWFDVISSSVVDMYKFRN